MTFDKIETYVKSTYSFESAFFGDIVLLMIYSMRESADKIGENKTPSNTKTNYREVCVHKTYYDAKVAAFGSDPSWILEIPDEQELISVTDAKIAAYKKGEVCRGRLAYFADNRKRILLESGRQDLFFYNLEEDFLMSFTGKYLPQPFFVSEMGSEKYKIKALMEHLVEKGRLICIPEIRGVPYYNQEGFGKKEIVLSYCDEANFEELRKMDDWKRGQRIKEILGVEQFRKPEDDDE